MIMTGTPKTRIFTDDDGDEFPLWQYAKETPSQLEDVASEYVREGNWTPNGKLVLQPYKGD
jgi:hypothetical protein